MKLVRSALIIYEQLDRHAENFLDEFEKIGRHLRSEMTGRWAKKAEHMHS